MFSSFYLKPGVYFKIADVPAPLVVSGDFIPIFIGEGRKEVDVLKTLVRGNAIDGTDIISSNDEIVLDILNVVDKNGIVYVKDRDYELVMDSNTDPKEYRISWNKKQSIIGSQSEPFDIILNVNDVLKLVVDGVSGTVILTAGNGRTASDIASDINGVFSGIASSDGGKVKLTGNSIYFDGYSSAMDTLGFTPDQYCLSLEPAANTEYTIGYKRVKKSVEYKQKIFTKLEDVYANYGVVNTPKTIFMQIVGSGITASDNTYTSNLIDSNANFSLVKPGNYIKITDGAGKGQIRNIVFVDVLNKKIIVAPKWDILPNATSKYIITDIGDYQISRAVYLSNLNGAQSFIVSQVVDDTVNAWKVAVDLTRENVEGFQGWCLVLLRSVDKNDSLVSYVKTYVNELNSTNENKERIALFGIKNNLTTINVIELLNNILDEAIGVIVNPYGKDDNDDIYGAEYIAAAISGIICNPNYDSGEPISGKIIKGFKYISNDYKTYEARLIGKNGGIIIEKQGVDYKIVHFLSTNTLDIIKSELKIMKQKHSLKKSLRSILENALLYSRALDIALARADSIARMVLDNKVNRGEIYSYDKFNVEFDSNDPRQLNISFMFKPMFDIDWIYITFGAHI